MKRPHLPQAGCRQAALISMGACLLLLILKGVAAHLSGSVALRSDALENLVNLVAALFTFGAIRSSDQPADATFPYGYGKIESLSALLEGGLVLLAAATIGYGAVRSWMVPRPLARLDAGMILNVLAGLGNGWLGWWLVRTGKRHRSQALEADGRHALTDALGTASVTGSLLLLRLTGWLWLDPVIALCLGLGLALTGWRMLRASSAALMDAEDPQLLDRLARSMEQVRPRDILGIHQVKTLRSGRNTLVDLHLVVPEFYSLARSHDLAEAFVAEAADGIGLKAEFRTHVDPCGRSQCQHCAVEACPMRRWGQGAASGRVPQPLPAQPACPPDLELLLAGRFHAL